MPNFIEEKIKEEYGPVLSGDSLSKKTSPIDQKMYKKPISALTHEVSTSDPLIPAWVFNREGEWGMVSRLDGVLPKSNYQTKLRINHQKRKFG